VDERVFIFADEKDVAGWGGPTEGEEVVAARFLPTSLAMLRFTVLCR